MTPYYSDDLVTIYHGDCLDVLPTLRVDAAISDPPYGVGVPYGPSYDDSRPDYWPWLRERVAAMRAAARVVAFTHRVTALRELTDWDWVAVWDKGGSFGPRVGNSPMVAGWEAVLLYGIHSIGLDGPALPDVIEVHPERTSNVMGGRIGREKWKDGQLGHHQDRRYRGSGPRLALQPPKTAAGRRTAPLAGFAARALATMPRDAVYVFHRHNGKPLNPSTVQRAFAAAVERAGLPPMHLHDARHTAATLALASGATLDDVKRMLGHSSIAITSDVYGHLVTGRQRAIADALDEAVS